MLTATALLRLSAKLHLAADQQQWTQLETLGLEFEKKVAQLVAQATAQDESLIAQLTQEQDQLMRKLQQAQRALTDAHRQEQKNFDSVHKYLASS